MSHRFTIASLSELLRVTQECTRALHAYGHHARGEPLRALLSALERRNSRAVTELEYLIMTLGGDPQMSGSAQTRPRLGWVALPQEPEDDDALLEACERGEDRALEVYRNAMDDHLPEFVRQTVTRQFEDLMDERDRIRVIRNEPPPGGATSLGGHAQP